MLACLASLAAGLFFSAGLAVRLELAALARAVAASRLAGVELMQAVLALLFLAGCVFTLRSAWKVLAVRTDFALARVAAHTAGAVTAPAGGADEIDRLVRALDAVADQLAGHLADGERLSRHAREQERFAARSLEFIYRACACLAENSASTPWLTALLEDMAGCLQARCCSLALLDPVAEGWACRRVGGAAPGPPARRVRRRGLARGGGLRRSVSGPAGRWSSWPCRCATPTTSTAC
jgi:hypothetical protein